MNIRFRAWWILPCLFVCFQIPFLFLPIQGLHKWRQADTAAVARNFIFESFDPFHPRMDVREDKTGITGMEFPAYQMAVAGGIAIAGDRDWVAKLVALIFAVVAWISMTTILCRRCQIDGWAAHGAMAASPLLFMYAARAMPETMALALAIIALERLDAYMMMRRTRDLVLSATVLALAILVRPYVGFAGIPLALAWIAECRAGRQGSPLLLAGLVALLPFVVWYAVWCPHLVSTYGISYYFSGSPFRDNLAAMAHPSLWANLGATIAQNVVGWACLILLPLGIWAIRRRLSDGSLRFGTATCLSFVFVVPLIVLPLLIGGHMNPHHYYLLVLVIPVAAVVAFAFDRLRQRWPRAGIGLCVLPVILMPVLLIHFYRLDRDLKWYDAVHGDVDARTSPSALFVVEDRGSYSWGLYVVRRRGWVMRRDLMDNRNYMAMLGSHGLEWVLWFDGHKYRLASLPEWIAILDRRMPVHESVDM